MYYKYNELRKAAIENPTLENMDALGEWFEKYGQMYWNGEYYDADGYKIYPDYFVDVNGDCTILGYVMY